VANNISESFGGTGTLTQAGTGNLVLTGTNSFTGGISVNSGTLSVNGATTGNATVSSGAVLGGSGTVTGNVNVMSGGVLAPGNSIGTLTVSGNLTFAAGSVYRVETDAAGNADRVNVIGAPGTLTINGGTVDVRAGAGNYARNTQYTILTSTGGRTGTFAGATSNLAFLTPTLVYDANSVYLNLLSSETASYGSVARTPNQKSVANYLGAFAGNPGNAQASELIRRIDNLSADQARNAFDALSGSQHASATQSALAGSRGFGDALGARVGSAGGNGGFGGFGGVSTLRGSAFGLGAMPWGASADAPLQLAGMFAGGAPLAASPSRGGGASSVSPSVSSSASSPAFPSASSSPSGSSGAPAASPGLSSGTAPPAAGLRDTGAAASGDAGGFGLTRANWGANTAGQNGLWAQALGSGGRIESDGNGAGHSYRAGGFLVGYDRALGDKWLIGAAGGYNRANWDAATLGVAPGTGKVETPQGAVYARYTGGAWMAAFSGSYADHKFDTSRTVAIGTGSSTATSSHRGQEWGLNATVEYALGAGAWQLRPLAGLRYTRLREEAFAESGAAGGSLTIDARTTESTTLSGGVRVLRAFNPGGSRQDAAADGGIELRAVYSHLFGENNAPIVARLAGQSASFTALGSPLKRDALTLGAGVSAKIGHGFTGYADVSYEVRGSGQDAYAIGAGVKYLW
jgi:outer membrane autotransporter protein